MVIKYIGHDLFIYLSDLRFTLKLNPEVHSQSMLYVSCAKSRVFFMKPIQSPLLGSLLGGSYKQRRRNRVVCP